MESRSYKKPIINYNFSLTETELSIFMKIRGYALTLKKKCVPRIAGGWVRDKLMGYACYDIDVALDTLSGIEFATGLREYFHKELGGRGIGVIRSNPDKSKHLETAAMIIDGVFVDFLNLRTESYADSRIPISSIGTPKEDAFRRDLTINSLFYNLMTSEVEDFTGMGLDDLSNGIIRTPLDPLSTFLDDPLRILRTIRFASRFQFKIEPEIFKAMKIKSVKEALKKKVSNERIGKEINKIIEDGNSPFGFHIILENNLVNEILKPEYECNINDSHQLYDYISSIGMHPLLDKNILCMYLLLIFFCGRKNQKDEFLNVNIVKKSLMYPNTITRRIKEIETNVFNFMQRIPNLDDKVEIIRQVRAMGKEWYNSSVIAMALFRSRGDILECDKIQDFVNGVFKYKLESVYLVKPVVNGKEIFDNLKVDCKNIKYYLEKGVEHQILSGCNDKKELMKYLKDFLNK
ncbi:CCA tRNA nucleotidyltransferase, mitochondrial [Astathelohania contejeani]|uniref:CCA tRNA nucleotidyltransferase, mitochondrial n=1 Tax=Astathelohania contejeani TaxID=164912 RepID=A0ABQ7I2T0_9MICR|nr:CCA tRNA nucleotidyltransferase, mitochondrial [Thelohania contejeani]